MKIYRRREASARREPIRGIAREALQFILASARSSHPDEFAAYLEERGGVIVNVLLLPGTVGRESSADLPGHMLPLGAPVAGSVHSHPSRDPEPSEEDLHLFASTGGVHIIAHHPYGPRSWACYDSDGDRVRLPVLDIELPEEEART